MNLAGLRIKNREKYMASIYKRTNKKGVAHWQVLIRRVGENTITSCYPTEALARAFAEETDNRILKERAEKLDPRASLPSSGVWFDETLLKAISLYAKTDKYTKQHASMLPTISRNIGTVTIGKLSGIWMENYVSHMRKQKTRRGDTFTFSTLLKHLVMIKVVLKWRAKQLGEGMPDFHIKTADIFPRDWEVKRERRLEAGEEARLHAQFKQVKGDAKHYWPLLLTLALETGARQQELIKATWNEVSPSFWTIPAKHTKCNKTRVVPLTLAARNAMDGLRKLRSPESSRLFHCWLDAPVVSAMFHEHVVGAGLIDFRFHDLRHEGISRFVLQQRNFSIYEVMKIVGHSSPEMIDRYANLRGDELAQKLI